MLNPGSQRSTLWWIRVQGLASFERLASDLVCSALNSFVQMFMVTVVAIVIAA